MAELVINALDELKNVQITDDTVLTIGTFDGVHRGHQKIISSVVKIAKANNYLAGCITFKENPREILRPENIFHYLVSVDERCKLLESLGLDIVVPLTFDRGLANVNAEDFVKLLLDNLNLKHLIVGPDFALGHKRAGTISVLTEIGERLGFQVESLEGYANNSDRVSSSLIRSVIMKEGDVALASKMLGRKYSITATVEKGHQRGEQIGYRTANLKIPIKRALPLDGVYITSTTIDSITYESVTNVGDNPTFGDKVISVETYILDFNDIIYGKMIKVEFHERLRGEVKFESPEKLSEQISIDVENTKAYFANNSN